MRMLVTGGAGYIGSHTAHHLAAAGHEVVILDTLEHGHRAAAGGLPLIVGSTADGPLVRRVLADRRIEAVIHFAAYKNAAESVDDPGRYFVNNVGGSLSLIESMVAVGVGLLVFSSTCAVYGTPERLPVVETSPLCPDNPYGESKLLVERTLPWYEAAHGLRWVSLRYFNAAGAEPDGSNGEDPRQAANLIPIVMQVATGRLARVEVYGFDYPTRDGTAIRDYVHVLDLAAAHRLAIEYMAAGRGSGTFNVGTGQGWTVREVIQAARGVTGRAIPSIDRGRRAGDPAAVWADSKLAQDALMWRPRHDLSGIITSAWRWHSLHPDGHEGRHGDGEDGS